MTITTNLEAIVLNNIAYHEMCPQNGAKPQSHRDACCWCWADDFAGDAMTVNACKGVLSSLVKKGFIVIHPNDPEDSEVDFTEAGFEAWKLIDDNRSD